MEIAVISDIHGNLPALQAALQDICQHDVDEIVNLGDVCYKGPFPDECVSLVRERKISTVRGNTDSRLVDVSQGRAAPPDPYELPYIKWHIDRLTEPNFAFLNTLPFEIKRTLCGQEFVFVHASPQDDVIGILPNDPDGLVRHRLAGVGADWVVMGHIHRPFVREFGATTLLNPGAIGYSLDGDPRLSYALINVTQRSARIVRLAYNIDDAVHAAKHRNFCFSPEWYRQALLRGWWEPIPWKTRMSVDRSP